MFPRSPAWLLLFALCVPALPALAADFEQRVAADPGGSLTVRLDSGEVEVEGHDEASVRVVATSSGLGDAMHFTLEARDGEIELRGRHRGVLGWLTAPRVRVSIRVPEQFSLDVRTSGGEIDVENLEGRLTARTSGGEVQVSEIRGPVELRTSGGRIRVEQVLGDVFARTSGGEVQIDEVEGRIDVETSGGPMELNDVSGPVRAHTSGGEISVRFTRPPAGEIRTSGGGIELEFPEGAGLALDARTSGGGVELDLPVAPGGEVGRDRVRGDLNGGGQRVELRTSGGSIRVRER